MKTINVMTILKTMVAVCLSLLLLQGCSLFGVGEAQYACPDPGKGVCKSARQIYDEIKVPSEPDSDPQRLIKPEKVDHRLVTPEPVAYRTPAQILRIWIAPWVDKQGNWHSGGVVMTDIAPREWQSAIPAHAH